MFASQLRPLMLTLVISCLGGAFARAEVVVSNQFMDQIEPLTAENQQLRMKYLAAEDKFNEAARLRPQDTKKLAQEFQTEIRTYYIPQNIKLIERFKKVKTLSQAERDGVQGFMKFNLTDDQTWRGVYGKLDQIIKEESRKPAQAAAPSSSSSSSDFAGPSKPGRDLPPEVESYLKLVSGFNNVMTAFQRYQAGKITSIQLSDTITAIRMDAKVFQLKLSGRKMKVTHNSKYVVLIDELMGLTQLVITAADQGLTYASGPRERTTDIRAMENTLNQVNRRSIKLNSYLDPSLKKDYPRP